jgi:protein sidekick
LDYTDVSLSTARIIWDVPSEPNGEILKYRVTYRKLEDRPDAANFTREFLPTDRTFRAVNLEPTTNYEFQVTAKTSLGWGLTARGLVLTTNNREAPQPPSAPQVSPSQIQDREITFSWNPGNDGYGPLRYYTVQYAENNGGWHTVPEQVGF